MQNLWLTVNGKLKYLFINSRLFKHNLYNLNFCRTQSQFSFSCLPSKIPIAILILLVTTWNPVYLHHPRKNDSLTSLDIWVSVTAVFALGLSVYNICWAIVYIPSNFSICTVHCFYGFWSWISGKLVSYCCSNPGMNCIVLPPWIRCLTPDHV